MQRGLLLILTFLLLLDLTDDGFFNKAKFVLPHSAAQISLTIKTLCHSGPNDAGDTLPASAFPESPDLNHFQQVILGDYPALTRIARCHTSSSGGLPL
jgi:hypothetical protein